MRSIGASGTDVVSHLDLSQQISHELSTFPRATMNATPFRPSIMVLVASLHFLVNALVVTQPRTTGAGPLKHAYCHLVPAQVYS